MDIYSTAFCLPRTPSAVFATPPSTRVTFSKESIESNFSYPKRHSTSSAFPNDSNGQHHVNGYGNGNGSNTTSFQTLDEAIESLCSTTMVNHQCSISSTPVESTTKRSERSYVIHITGTYQNVMSARGTILRESPFKRQEIVKIPGAEVLDVRDQMHPEMRRRFDEIGTLTSTRLDLLGHGAGNIEVGLETERYVEIGILGGYENVEQARVRLLVVLDELSGLHSEVCEIDYKLHNIVAGRKRCVIQSIQEATATNVYFPTALSGVLGNCTDHTLLSRQNAIWITGEFFQVQRAKDMLFQVAARKSKCIISRDTAILPRKLDWLLTEKLDEIKSTMNDNSTFINFPPLGSQVSMIAVYGDHRVNIERSIRTIMQLACQYYVGSFWLLPISFDVFIPPSTINPAQIPTVLRHIATTTGVEAIIKSNCFELHGVEQEVRTAVKIVLELDFVKSFHHEIRFQIELANEHREFISGKKNGKLNKIAKASDVKIKFETFNDYNFLIDLSTSGAGALHGLSLLQEELPAEISFHVPEVYHKRIIGVSGKNIQKIMKEFGVYVKFANAEEFAMLGGYHENEDNVIARTPAKNTTNLEHLKSAVMELIGARDEEFVRETVTIPRRYHRTLLGEKSIFVHDIEGKTNSIVRFPNAENASDAVSVYGPETQAAIAVQMLLDHIPCEAEYRLPHNNDMISLVSSTEFVALSERIKDDLNITVIPVVDASGAEEETIIRFCLNRSNVDAVASARDMVEEFLVANNIQLGSSSSRRPRSASSHDPFPFFASKLLSSNSTDSDHQNAPRNRLRLAVSSPNIRLAASPNIKALFDGTANSSLYPESIPEQQDGIIFYSPHQSSPSALPRFASRQMSHSNLFHSATAAASYRSSQEVAKRGTDTTVVDQLARSGHRTLSHRAQSLDLGSTRISHHAARQREVLNEEVYTNSFAQLGL